MQITDKISVSNVFFNIVSVSIGVYGTLAEMQGKHWTIMQNCNRLSCATGAIYFIYDTYVEGVIYKRITFIPHHLISLIFVYKFLTLSDIPMIRMGPILLLCGEGSSLLVNLREILKDKKQLTTKRDIAVLILYFILRNGIITPIVYNNRKNNTEVWYGWIAIFLMSNYWCYMWTKSILKHVK
jgi:hypothetical protein